MKHLFISAIFCLISVIVFSQDTAYMKTYGTIRTEIGSSLVQGDDGFYYLFGKSDSLNAGVFDFYLLKVDTDGNLITTYFYDSGDSGGTLMQDEGRFIMQTDDGGMLMVGEVSKSSPPDPDILVFKTDNNGVLQWKRTLGVDGFFKRESGYGACKASDGGYIVVGTSNSFSGKNDIYIEKINTDGTSAWFKYYGSTGDAQPTSIKPIQGGGYIISALTNYNGIYAALLKVDVNGDTTTGGWLKNYAVFTSPAIPIANANSVIVLPDQSYVFAGNNYSEDPPSSGNFLTKLFLVHTDMNGAIIGSPKTFSTSDNKSLDGKSIIRSGSSYMITGAARGGDFFVMRTDSAFNQTYFYSDTTTPVDNGSAIIEDRQGDYLALGSRTDLSLSTSDMLLLKYWGCNSLSVTCTGTVVDSFGNVSFASTVAGGHSGYTYSWSGDESFASTAANPSFQFTGNGTKNYQLSVTDVWGCSTTCSGTVNLSGLGFHEKENNKFQIAVYPNPFAENASIRIQTTTNEKIQLKITNLQSQQVMNLFEGKIEPNNPLTIPLKQLNLASGAYCLTVLDGQKNFANKFIKIGSK